MIRQKKSRAYLQKSSFKVQSLQNSIQSKDKQIQEKQNFEEGVLNKFFKLNINNQSPFCYVSEAKKNPFNKNHKPALYIRGRKTKSRVQDKENIFQEATLIPQGKQKLILLQTTGNSLLSFKKYKKHQKQHKNPNGRPTTPRSLQFKHHRPKTAISSYRSSLQSNQLQDHTLTKVLQQLSKRQSSQSIKQKISTSQALVMFSKVIRNNQNSSRQLFKRKIKSHSSNQRYKSVSIMASKVKMQPKDSKQLNSTKKLDFKSYLQKFHLIGNGNNNNNNNQSQRTSLNRTKKKEEYFNLQGWETNQIEGF